jgi:hypothetical protein
MMQPYRTFAARGSRLAARGSRLAARGSRFAVRGSRFAVRGSPSEGAKIRGSNEQRGTSANERASEPTGAERGVRGPASERVRESEGRSLSE